MSKKLDWNYKEVKENATEEGFTNLPVGPQVVRIENIEDLENKKYLKIMFDITEGPLKNHFKEQQARFGGDWPEQGVVRRSYKDSAKYFFAGFITALEKSNDGFEFDPDKNWTEQFLGKIFVANFGKEEYFDEKEEVIKTSLKCRETRSTQALREGEIDILPLEEYSGDKKPKAQNESSGSKNVDTGNFEVEDDDLPF